MKALTLTQPWATLIAIGAKWIETRSWATEYRGPLAIHSARRFPSVARDLCIEQPFFATLSRAGYRASTLPLGMVLATSTLVDCLPTGGDFPSGQLPWGDFTPGRYAWILRDISPFPEPLPARGALGLWEWMPPEEVALP